MFGLDREIFVLLFELDQEKGVTAMWKIINVHEFEKWKKDDNGMDKSGAREIKN